MGLALMERGVNASVVPPYRKVLLVRARIASVFVALSLVLAACGIVPRAAPYDPVIEDTVTGFDKAFQTFVVKLNRTAGTAAGRYERHHDFYEKWQGELAHLRNRAIATDPSEACPLSGATADVFEVIVQTTGASGAEVLEGASELTELAGVAVMRVENKLDNLSDELNQPSGTLTPAQVNELEAEIAAWEEKRTRLQRVLSELQGTTVSEPEGGCATIVVAKLEEQFSNFERFHKAQGDIGVPARARAPVILMNITIQNVLKLQAVKREKTQAGLL